MADRWGQPAEELPDDHQAWEFEAHYMAALCNNIVFMHRPDVIVLGGGMFGRVSLYDKVRNKLEAMLAGYALSGNELDMTKLIREPGLTQIAPGLMGAFLLAQEAVS